MGEGGGQYFRGIAARYFAAVIGSMTAGVLNFVVVTRLVSSYVVFVGCFSRLRVSNGDPSAVPVQRVFNR